jgi:hypothetical protein
VGANCTLVNAIRSANTNTSVGGCTAGSGASDSIFLPTNSTQTLSTVDNTTFGPTGLPVIRSAIIIFGNNSRIVRSSAAGTPAFRIFAVNETGNLTLRNSIVSGGKTIDTDPGQSYSATNSKGGGIFISDGSATLISSTITGNSASRGGGIYNTADTNKNFGTYGVLNLSNTTISGNSAEIGGGIMDDGVTLAKNTTFSKNSANYGGGLYISYSGLYGHTQLTNCTISGNSAASRGGGLISGLRTNVALHNTTISGNAAQVGGGIFVTSKGAVGLNQSLVSGNKAPESSEIYNFPGSDYDEQGSVSADFSIFGFGGSAGVSGFTPRPNNIVPTQALSAIIETTLSNNSGGPTQTHHLPKGSPAVDAVPVSECPQPAIDQRGVARPIDADGDHVAECDVGAYERIPDILSCKRFPPSSGCTVNGVPNQVCLGTSGNDTITGTAGANVIVGASGNDIVNGGGGADRICGGLGADRLSGGDGNDMIFGEEGNDMLLGNLGNDQLDGGSGTDTCQGNEGSGDTAVSCETKSTVP